VERELDYWSPGATASQPIRVCIGTPAQDIPTAGGVDWSCTLSIEGFERPYTQRFFQVDPLGAFLAATAIAPLVLRSFVPDGGRLTWLGREDLGLPLLSPPCQDWICTPANGGTPHRLDLRIGHPERTEGGWSALVTATDYGREEEEDEYTTLEKRVHGSTMAHALECAAALAPSLVQELVDRMGGGTLTDPDAPMPIGGGCLPPEQPPCP
jgi:hypothetical protein